MKSLFLATQPLFEGSGISHKIKTQHRAFVENGLDMSFCYQKVETDGTINYYIDGQFLFSMGRGFKAHLALYYQYDEIYNYITQNKIDFVFIRYIQLANPFYNHFLKKIKKAGATIYIEIPTYPYDGEYTVGIAKKIQKKIEKIYRNRFSKYVDRVVTYADTPNIFGIPTIKISNGVDMDSVPTRCIHNHSTVNLLGVAMLAKWHGYDRLIEGIGNYYAKGGTEDVHFYIIGSKGQITDEYQQIAEKYKISDRIHIEGIKSGSDLDRYFDIADLAIGCLACHRKNITSVKSLKNVEYAARGIAFTYSEENDDFDSMPYVLKQVPDESPIDVSEMIKFIKTVQLYPEQIRDTVESTYSWRYQIRTVVKSLL